VERTTWQEVTLGVCAEKFSAKNNGSGQLVYCPCRGHSRSTLDASFESLLAAAETFIVGVPYHDASFRAFTASPTVGKGTPTAQRFDNRSIA
jgi:hypothetical protein